MFEKFSAKLLYLLPLIFPFYLIKFEVSGLPFNVLEIAVLLLLVEFLVRQTREILNIKEDRKFWWKQFWLRNKNFFLWSSLFLLISIVAVAIVPLRTTLIDGQIVYESKKVALGIWKSWIVLPYLYFVMLWFSTRQKSQLFTSIYAYVFSALPLVIWAIYQYFTGDFITLDGRASGPYINANYLAMYLSPAVVALWILIVRGILFGFKLKKFVIGMVLAAFYSIALLMTQSYGAMLAVMLTLLFYLVISSHVLKSHGKNDEYFLLKKIGYFLGVFALVAVMSALVLFAKTEKWKMFTEIHDRSSSSVRLEVYQIAANFIEKSPFLGIGLGQFEPKYNLESPHILGHAPFEWVMIHPHNTFLAVWLNLGIVGLLMFLYLIYICLKRFVLNNSFDNQYFRLIGISMFLVTLLHGMVDTNLFKNDLAMLFWLIVALCLLPRFYKIEGTVVEGAKIGRTIGFPTANLKIDSSNLPMEKLEYGVYAAMLNRANGERFLGGLSYGPRPTVDSNPVPTMEVHLLDFDDNLYGEKVQLEILDWIRAIYKFRDLDELKANLENDLKEVRSKIRI